jgi:hypothetical protein
MTSDNYSYIWDLIRNNAYCRLAGYIVEERLPSTGEWYNVTGPMPTRKEARERKRFFKEAEPYRKLRIARLVKVYD